MDPWLPPDKVWMLGTFVGGGGGTVLGLLGAMAAVLAPRGKGRPFVLGAMGLVVVCGLGLVAAGLVALAMGQPFHIWFWLLEPGVLFAVLGSVMLPIVRHVYVQAEHRKIDAEALRRG